MATTTRRDLTGPILDALGTLVPDPSRDNQKVRPAFTVHALASAIKANPSATETALRKLQRAGKVVIRHHRSGDVLYKLSDQFRPGVAQLDVSTPRKSRGERPKGGRKVHMTGAF
jgi:DNA-binding transcriptional ArsR family regulator